MAWAASFTDNGFAFKHRGPLQAFALDTTFALLDLAGSVALLLWGVHMVQTGIERAFGPHLRRVLGNALGNRTKAFGAGIGITAMLQSSTAAGLMLASFANRGLVKLVPALAVMLGANVGTTLIVQALSYDVSHLAPALVLVGVVMFRRGTDSRTRDLGRVAIGLGLMIWALGRLHAIITPYEGSEELRVILANVTSAPVVLVLLAAILTWAAHSSVAIVLLVMSCAAKGMIEPAAALALVIGANLGTAINPVLEATCRDPESRRVVVGNLVNRALGCIVALALLDVMGAQLALLGDPARAVANFHTLFNIALAVLFLPLLGPYAKFLCRWLPGRVDDKDPARPMYLDPAARETPPIALAGAAREALRMADVLESMLTNTTVAIVQNDRVKVAETKRMDDVLDKLNHAIKSYLTAFDPDTLPPIDNRRLLEIRAFATNIEHAGDVLVRNVMALTAKKLKQGLVFSLEGEAEIRVMLERLIKNLRAAVAVFMTQDARAAEQLAQEKHSFRLLETHTVDAHFARLRSGRLESAQTSSLHLDLIRDLKRINAHLVAAAISPVMRDRGLASNRLPT